MNTTDNIRTRYRPFLVKFHGPSNTRGSRFTIHDLRHDKRKTIGRDHSASGMAVDQATDYLRSIGIEISALALFDVPVNGAGTECLLLSPDFSTPLK